MIRLIGVEGKVFVLDLVSDMEGTISLTGGVSKDVEENICTLEELKYIETSFKTKRVLMSEGDFTKLLTAIENKQYGGGTAPYHELPVATKNSLGGVIVSDYLKIDTSGKLSVDFETTFNTQLNNYALKTEIPLLERTPSSNTLPVLANRVPLYSLGTDGNFVLCTPNAWIKLDENLFMPAYTGEVLGLHP